MPHLKLNSRAIIANYDVPVESEDVKTLGRRLSKKYRPTFKNSRLIYQSKDNSDMKICLVKSCIILTQKIGNCW